MKNKSYYVSLFVSLIIQIINPHYLVQNKSHVISEDDGELLRRRPRTMCVENSERILTVQHSVYSEPVSSQQWTRGVEGGSRKIAQGTAAAVQGAKDCDTPLLNLGRDYWSSG